MKEISVGDLREEMMNVRTTESILGNEGTYANARGVCQGSVEGGMKWVVFMNFWLEYVHIKAKGTGYKTNSSAPETIGQMFIDDNNWITTNTADMTAMIADCDAFVSFHGLKFNKKKCEYMAVNQPDYRENGFTYSAWDLPTWPNGDPIAPKARNVEDMHRWKLEHEDILDQVATYEGDCIRMDNADERHLVTSQPCVEEVKKIKCMLRECGGGVKRDEDPAKESKHMRAIARALNMLKGRTYGEATEEEVNRSTECWAEQWQQWVCLEIRHALEIEQATRYLGVFFNMNLSWREQIRAIRRKFQDMCDRINRTCPTAEMAIYCLNAVVNAALRFPLQVAAIPVTVLREWDSKNRVTVKKATFLPRNTCPELLHLPKREGGRGLPCLEHEIDILRIQTRMRLLNAHSSAGAVVRTAKLRYDNGKERSTIQFHTEAALRRWGMHIKCVGLRSGEDITEIDEQIEEDIRVADA